MNSRRREMQANLVASGKTPKEAYDIIKPLKIKGKRKKYSEV